MNVNFVAIIFIALQIFSFNIQYQNLSIIDTNPFALKIIPFGNENSTDEIKESVDVLKRLLH